MEIPSEGILCDLLWSDPINNNKDQWMRNTVRACSYYYSNTHALEFLKKNHLQSIIRGHEVQLKGFLFQELDKNQSKNIITIFSAPNYCKKYNNFGAVAQIQPHSFKVKIYKYIEQPQIPPISLNIMNWGLETLYRKTNKIFLALMKSKLNRNISNSSDMVKANKFNETEQLYQRMDLLLSTKGGDSIIEDDVMEESGLDKLEFKISPQKQDIVNTLYFIIMLKHEEKSEAMPVKYDEKWASNKEQFFKTKQIIRTLNIVRCIGPKIKQFQKIQFNRFQENDMASIQ